MLRPDEIVRFDDTPPPAGASPWVGSQEPSHEIEIVPADPDWPRRFDTLASLIAGALGDRALSFEHVGSTSVPGLDAKPIIDIDLVVADSTDEASYVPDLEAAGFVLRVREPWWYEHRCLVFADPRCNLHVFSSDCPESARHRLFRDWLRANPADRQQYRDAKVAAATEANARGEHVMQYNARKQDVIREIYARAFRAAGWLTPPDENEEGLPMKDGYLVAPVNEAERARLAGSGLDVRLVPADDGDAFANWIQVVARGFQDGERSDEQVAANRERSGYRRMTGIFDASAPLPDAPVATIASWIGELTVPGGRGIPSCAISAVTVAPTHRRRGIARAMLEGELGVAVAAGIPAAMLTVSESPLYGRYGFAPAAASASWRIDVKRAAWIGPRPAGRVDFIPRERLRALAPDLHERVRLSVAGEVDIVGAHWDTLAGTRPDAKEPGNSRAIQYTDAAGEVRGLALYSVRENHDDFTKATVTIGYLLTETADAYAALWKFFLELDLVGEVHAHEQSVDEPLRWMIADQRAAVVTIRDHQYVRILDVAAALEARVFGASGVVALEVSDPLGYAAGRWLLNVDADGRGTVTAWDGPEAPAGAVQVELGIEELSAVYLGGVSLATLAAAGRVRSADAAAAARVFGWHSAPRLSIWY